MSSSFMTYNSVCKDGHAKRKEDVMSRQITFYKFEIGIKQMEQAADGRYDLVKTPVTTVEDSSMTNTQIRAAIKAAGVDCPRGSDVYATKVGKVMYKFTTENLLKIADERIELPM